MVVFWDIIMFLGIELWFLGYKGVFWDIMVIFKCTKVEF